MKCPWCESTQVNKNGHRRGKQNYRCKMCDRQFVEAYTQRGYTDEIKQICLRMYSLGVTLRDIEKFTGVCPSTVSHWCKQMNLKPNCLQNPKDS